MKNIDDLLEKALKNSDHSPSNEEKMEVWNEIEEQLFTNKEGVAPMKRKKQKKWKIIGILATASILLIVLFALETTPGSALIDRVKTLFVPEKKIIIDIEGTDEKTNTEIKEGKSEEGQVQYVIYIDKDRYKLINSESGDIITTIEPLGEPYPEVSMKIMQFPNETKEDLYNEWKPKILEEYPKIIVDEKVNTPVSGLFIQAQKDGNGWNTENTKVYFIDNGKGGSFIIQQKLFLEASEGHGVRFDEMLKEFHLLPDSE